MCNPKRGEAFVIKQENFAFFLKFFWAKFGGLPGNLYLCTRFR